MLVMGAIGKSEGIAKVATGFGEAWILTLTSDSLNFLSTVVID